MEPDVRLLELLPDWIRYSRLVIGPLTAFCGSFLGIWIAARLVAPRLSSLEGLHWAERARRVYPAKKLAGCSPLFMVVFFYGFFSAEAGPFNAVPRGWVGASAAVAAFGSALLASTSIHRLVTGEKISWWRNTRSYLLNALLFLPELFVVLFMLGTVGEELGPISIGCGVVGMIALGFVALHSGLPLVRLLGAVRPASPRLQALVSAVGNEMGIGPRSVEEADLGVSNALAFPHCGRLLFTTQVVADLDDAALRAVIAHELAHLRQYPSIWMATLRVLAFLPLGLLVPIVHRFGSLGWLVAYTSFVLILLEMNKTSRRCEQSADHAVSSEEIDPADYARALERLHVRDLVPAVMRSCATHPSLYDRMESTGIQPDFPRPHPPSTTLTAVGQLAAGVLTIAVVIAMSWIPVAVFARDTDKERSALAQIALRGAKPRLLFNLVIERMRDGRDAEALGLVNAVLERRPEHHAYLAARADLLARMGSCDAAADDLRGAIGFVGEDHAQTCRWLERATQTVSACEAPVARR